MKVACRTSVAWLEVFGPEESTRYCFALRDGLKTLEHELSLLAWGSLHPCTWHSWELSLRESLSHWKAFHSQKRASDPGPLKVPSVTHQAVCSLMWSFVLGRVGRVCLGLQRWDRWRQWRRVALSVVLRAKWLGFESHPYTYCVISLGLRVLSCQMEITS